jgi:hypothetical protein
MKKPFIILFAAAFLLCSGSLAAARTLIIVPSDQTVSAGATVDVGVAISGLGSGTPPSLSVFDLDVTFDNSILSFQGFTFGDPMLGDQLDHFGLGSLTSVTSGAGTVNLFQLSFDLPADLDALQAGDFTLGTLAFLAVSSGVSNLGVSVNALGNASGDPLTMDVLGGRVVVDAAPVPEPAALLLLLAAGVVRRAVIRARAQ